MLLQPGFASDDDAAMTAAGKSRRHTPSARVRRHLTAFAIGLAAIWIPVAAYVLASPLVYTSEFSLILPGSGASSTVSISDIGQASTSATSPYASGVVSPTATYKRLLGARRVRKAAAKSLGVTLDEFGAPDIELVEETSLIIAGMDGPDPATAQWRAATLLKSFMDELDRLRQDEIKRRGEGVQAPVSEYEKGVAAARERIAALQASSGLISTAQYEALVASVETLEGQLREHEADSQRAEGEAVALRDALDATPESAALTLKLNADTEFQVLVAEMSKYASDLATARGAYGERHPEVVAAREAYEGARSRLRDRAREVTGLDETDLDGKIEMSVSGERAALLSQLVKAATECKGLKQQVAKLKDSLDKQRKEVMRLVGPAATLDGLNRDYQVAEAVFASALARTDTTKTDVYSSYPLIQVLEDATLPENPSSPHVLIALAAGAGAVFFLLVAHGLVWIRRPLIGLLVQRAEG